MKCKIFTIDSFNVSNKKLLGFNFCVDESLKKDSIMATIKEFMAEINPKYSIYVSPATHDCDKENIKTLKEIKQILIDSLNPKEKE